MSEETPLLSFRMEDFLDKNRRRPAIADFRLALQTAATEKYHAAHGL